MNIFLKYKDQSLPAIHIIMSKKTGRLYDIIVAKVKEILPFIATLIKTDYENALYYSFAKNYPQERVSGCLFHYARGLYKLELSKMGYQITMLEIKNFDNG